MVEREGGEEGEGGGEEGVKWLLTFRIMRQLLDHISVVALKGQAKRNKNYTKNACTFLPRCAGNFNLVSKLYFSTFD